MSGQRLQCSHFQRGECRSCQWIEREYLQQLQAKQQACEASLALPGLDWQPAWPSPLHGFRNKAKLVVGGSQQAPRLGSIGAEQQVIDLDQCGLYPAALASSFAALREFIVSAALPPYDIAGRRGELKYLLLTLGTDQQSLMLRFVLRSREALGRIGKHLPQLQAALPQLQVVSANIQPLPAAILEGPEEIALSPQQLLPMRLNDVELLLQPGGFFQTNSVVAAALYRQARAWTAALPIRSVLDLYCGVGGFALHLATAERVVQGIERSAAAIEAARTAAQRSALPARFSVADAEADPPLQADLVVVNPPRRGLGAALCQGIEASPAQWLLYSSCNPTSLAQDLTRLPGFRPVRGQVFDMFPHTPHSEVLLLLQRNPR